MTDVADDPLTGVAPGSEGGTARSTASGSTSSRGDRELKPWQLRSAEAAVSVAAAIAFLLVCMHISVNPMVRIGQVSGLAKVQQYAAMIGLPILAVLLYTVRRGGADRYRLTLRLVCAALAGLATGVVAGGIAVALHGTPWGLGGQEGDPGNVMGMANDMLRPEKNHYLPGVYPPLFPAVLALWAKLFHGGIPGMGFAMKDLQLLCSALAGPMAYLAWRLLLRPFWALALAAPAAILFLDPIRPYSHVTMMVMVPMVAGCLREMCRAHELTTRSAVLRAAGFGASFGLLFLWYSGWFVWTVPGVMVLALFLVPWRGGKARLQRALLFLGVTLVAAAVTGFPLLYQILRLGASTNDRYAYVMTYIDPAYVMGWVSDRQGLANYHTWPVGGEFAGQSTETLLLLAGAALALGLGLRNMIVRTAAAGLVSAWLARFWIASHMEHTQAVQLYPRTTWIIMYCLIILAVMGLMLTVQRLIVWFRALSAASDNPIATRISPASIGRVTAGAICAIALFATMAGSWSADRYMPSTNPGVEDMGLDAYRAHILQDATGKCPKYSPVSHCGPANLDLSEYTFGPDDHKLFCGDTGAAAEWPIVCGRTRPW